MWVGINSKKFLEGWINGGGKKYILNVITNTYVTTYVDTLEEALQVTNTDQVRVNFICHWTILIVLHINYAKYFCSLIKIGLSNDHSF